MTEEDTSLLLRFMACAYRAWGREAQNNRLWSTLNLVMCMWFYRHGARPRNPKSTKFSDDLFTKCLMALSANEDYRGWIVGRRLGEIDRSPCFRRMKDIFSARVRLETGQKASLIQPEWASH